MKKDLWIVALSGLQYGYNTSIIAGALLFVTQVFSLTPIQQGVVTSITLFGAVVASAFAGTLADRIGRRSSLGLSVLCFVAGCALSMLANNPSVLLAGRLFVGLGSGLATIVAPLYLVEAAPPEIRGKAANLNQIGISLGSLLAFGAGYLFGKHGDWRLMFGVGIIPALVQWVGLFFVQEIRVQRQQFAWKELIAPEYRARLRLGLALMVFQALCGVSALMYFAPQLFQSVGVDTQAALRAGVALSIGYTLAIFASSWLVDRLGRRRLLLLSLVGIVAGLGIASVAPVTGIALACAAYGLGVGPVPPLVVGEFSPDALRSHAMTVVGLGGWATNYLVVLTCLPLTHRFGLGPVFAVYAAFCLMAFMLVLRKLPETKQKSLAEIDELFRTGDH